MIIIYLLKLIALESLSSAVLINTNMIDATDTIANTQL